jgi:alanine or glycine:cation symporter, AGCS family
MSLLYLVTVLDRWLASFVEFCAVPATLLFFGIAILLTFRTGWMQFRGFSRFMFLIRQALYKGGIKQVSQEYNTINPFHALSTAMATTIGMGNIVGPSIAIMLGGPGALFWLVIYIFFAASTKFIEVTFALHTRVPTPAGTMVGGPMYYLRSLSNGLSQWYVWVMIFLFMAWSSLQANTLAWVFLEEGIPAWIIGTLLALTVFIVLRGGVERVGLVTARLVPIMFIVYVIFSVAILGTHLSALRDAIVLVYSCIFNSAAPLGGFMGATIYQALQAGIYKGIYISEAGIGSASIPHAVSDIKNPVDQGLPHEVR